MWTDKHARRRGHSLMSKSLGKKIPSLGTYANSSREQVREVPPTAKLFTPMSNWTWYIMEWDAETGRCFGLAQGAEQEFGNFHLDELSEATAFGGVLLVERDCYWNPETIGEIMESWHDPRAGAGTYERGQ